MIRENQNKLSIFDEIIFVWLESRFFYFYHYFFYYYYYFCLVWWAQLDLLQYTLLLSTKIDENDIIYYIHVSVYIYLCKSKNVLVSEMKLSADRCNTWLCYKIFCLHLDTLEEIYFMNGLLHFFPSCYKLTQETSIFMCLLAIQKSLAYHIRQVKI